MMDMVSNFVSLIWRKRSLAVGLIFALAAGCAATPQPNPHHKVGSPYRVDGKVYTPRKDPRYNRVGIASWYGSQFHGKLTANGEVFDKSLLSAAHKTLPLPSIVEVENLENGRKLAVRLNDRGPFVDDRIIDLSEAAAKELGFQGKGLAKVRVRYVGPAKLQEMAARPGRANRYKVASKKQRSSSSRVRTASASAPVTTRLRGRVSNTSRGSNRSAGQQITQLNTSRTNGAVLNAGPTEDAIAMLIDREVGSTLTPAPSSSAFDASRDFHPIDLQIFVEVAGFHDARAVKVAQLDLSDVGPSRHEQLNTSVHTLLIGPYNDHVTANAWLAAVQDAGYPQAQLVARSR